MAEADTPHEPLSPDLVTAGTAAGTTS